VPSLSGQDRHHVVETGADRCGGYILLAPGRSSPQVVGHVLLTGVDGHGVGNFNKLISEAEAKVRWD
jgi:hypothetical protein